jgi:hypothetical protein
MKYLQAVALAFCLFLISVRVIAQDLEPRAYARIPVNASIIVAGFGYSNGGVVTDATLSVKDVNAIVNSPSLAGLRSFSFFGQTAQVSAGIPYLIAKVSGSVEETA